ncbi:MAG: D-alanyl-D-alanine carboxypeptidase [Flavobacteriaceae bacterium]
MLKSINIITENTSKYIRNFLLLSVIALLLGLQFGCGSAKYRRLENSIGLQLNSDALSNHHTGFMLYDPLSKDTLISKDSKRYFIPASNVKIFTLYTSLKLLPEKMPVLKYSISGDTLYFEGQADPAGLHPYFKDSTALEFLGDFKFIRYSPKNIASTAFGPGWAWEDYDQSYAAPRSSFPFYGNVVSIYPNSIEPVYPNYFKDSISLKESVFRRLDKRNYFYVPPGNSDTIEIPFKLNPDLTARLLQDRLDRDVIIVNAMPNGKKEVLFGFSRDSILKRMMVESDNLLAEQMLLAASARLSDTLKSKEAISHMMEVEFSDLNPLPRWVDGSGLSRYNIFTPEAMVHVLNKLYLEYDQEYIFVFFPKGGVSGTLEDDFSGNPHPYIYAKTGSLGNIYCLSGYLRSKSGRLLIFSFMNNHFTIGSKRLKAEMTSILEMVRDSY